MGGLEKNANFFLVRTFACHPERRLGVVEGSVAEFGWWEAMLSNHRLLASLRNPPGRDRLNSYYKVIINPGK